MELVEVPTRPQGYLKNYLQIVRAVNEEAKQQIRLQDPVLLGFSLERRLTDA